MDTGGHKRNAGLGFVTILPKKALTRQQLDAIESVRLETVTALGLLLFRELDIDQLLESASPGDANFDEVTSMLARKGGEISVQRIRLKAAARARVHAIMNERHGLSPPIAPAPSTT